MSKNKTKKGKARVNVDLHSDSDSVNDMASVYSCGSLEDDNNGDDTHLLSASEKYEEKLLQAIESATEKSTQTRIQALKIIIEILQHRHIADFLEDRKFTIMDIVEKSLRRGKGLEQDMATRLATLLAIQLGGGDSISSTLCQILTSILQNPTSSYSVRAISCTAIAMLHFLNSDNIGDIVGTMQQFEQIFAGSYLKGDQTAPTVSEDVAQLHVSALSGYGLLATLIPAGDFCSYVTNGSVLSSIKNLIGLLQSPHVDVRMTCGEIIAIILECGRVYDEEFMCAYVPDLIELTSELAKDSQKFRAKKERKAQRASFRDVLRYLEENITPEIQIRFGKETLDLCTWSIAIQYEKLCDVIGPGITTHLTENEFLRDILQLGSKVVDTKSMTVKQSKLERHLINAASFKARTLSLKKNRDKRSAVFN
ncbi:interferon-related developmental regulator 1 [Contarinia nasturtii]|uniref:interferon-related developmental regulator 1 n=1 Tax=Contarinia nasturtii TaxID=265458 RepID=UPI0012D46497|nr:interferon-related developmental regulator 1 [Contarinia nasturtii]XP_031639706.1 interferon-related developmental regulator 1 [Contarinia nasturtii]XP_031639707.1 interferon-related developmental regulator 1 [Contarinia nasturtii]XP_031639708.1 interferon-related developmental regulator 1 [Contarinia nasturtii]XP_031639709.1 interferon-related developmental regulator 1 [Contarinia nasturtii]XP_031639710.1 interferon-related developmental regulator 1 [Contarinia nasturtii]